MTMVSRNIESDAALPLLMVFIPSVFYIIIFSTGIGLDGAREGGWVGDVAPPGTNAQCDFDGKRLFTLYA
jgi:hypothetical protein